jgi:two-component system NtrC family sensor kinase
VIVNLVKNAIDAMPNGGSLTARTSHKSDTVVLSIIDTGSGMTGDQMQRVFTPFFTTKDPGKGTGLGLSVSLSVIKSLGGNIYFSSVPGRGSVFRVELPYELVDSDSGRSK